jgi:hypothetical protein
MTKLADQHSLRVYPVVDGEGTGEASSGITRLAAIAQANLADAQVWRWFSDGMEDGRIRVTRQHANWVIVVDGVSSGVDESLDAAVRDVYERIGTLAPTTTSWSRFSGSFMAPMDNDDTSSSNG